MEERHREEEVEGVAFMDTLVVALTHTLEVVEGVGVSRKGEALEVGVSPPPTPPLDPLGEWEVEGVGLTEMDPVPLWLKVPVGQGEGEPLLLSELLTVCVHDGVVDRDPVTLPENESVAVPFKLVVMDTVGDMLRDRECVWVTLRVGDWEGVKLAVSLPYPVVEAQKVVEALLLPDAQKLGVRLVEMEAVLQAL